jgi:dTMP kinase
VVLTREPGATVLGKSIRSLVLERKDEAPCERAELFLFAADRAQHVEKVIRPALAAGSWVISDRYFYSTTAFQGYGRQLDRAVIEQVNKLAVADTYPGLVLLLDLDPQTGLERARGRQAGAAEKIHDAFEAEALEFHRRIREGFLEIAAQSSQPFAILDASRSREAVFETARVYLDVLLARSKKERGS